MQIKAAMDEVMLPLSTTIEQEVANLQAEADSITLRGEAEHAQVNKELAELAQLVHTFQVWLQVLEVFLAQLTGITRT